MSNDELFAKRDAEFFKAYAKDKTLTRAKFYAKNPIVVPQKPRGFVDMPRDFNKASPSPAIQKIHVALATYCAKFPDVKTPNIVLSGGTGTGKTYTAQIVANILLDRKFDVQYTTAFALVNAFQRYVQSFGTDTDAIEKFIECDLLVIDDLGLEPTIKNVTQEHIYNIINERLCQRRAFIITTNLCPSDIMQRYDQRIASRILSKQTSTIIEFSGKDMRLAPN